MGNRNRNLSSAQFTTPALGARTSGGFAPDDSDFDAMYPHASHNVGDYTFTYDDSQFDRGPNAPDHEVVIDALATPKFGHEDADPFVGFMRLSPGDEGGVRTITQVSSEYPRTGIATGLYKQAENMGYKIRHSDMRTDAGDAWAHKVGGDIPPRHPDWQKYGGDY